MNRAIRAVLPTLAFGCGAGCSGPVAPLDGDLAWDTASSFDAASSRDGSSDVRMSMTDAGVDAPIDAFVERPDAFRVAPEVIYLNPVAPDCVDRSQPPRWTADNGDAAEGTLLWTVSLREPRFTSWLGEQRDRSPWWVDAPPSLSGNGIATWYSYNDSVDRTWAIGVQGPDGVFANSGMVDLHGLPRIWLPRRNMLLSGNASGGRLMYAPQPKFYSPESTEDLNVSVLTAAGGRLWEGGARPSIARTGDMPAWSPTTGDFVGFGVLHDMGREHYRGVAAFCSEGTRWFTQLPIHQGLSNAYVRPDGDVVVATRGEAWVLNGEDGEPLRNATYVDSGGIQGFPAAYEPGCGILLQYFERTWRWLNDDSMTLGPALDLPSDRLTGRSGWSGTPDCGVVAVGGSETVYVTRLDADGSIRFSVVLRGPESVGTAAAPPVALDDGGTLVVTIPTGWVRYSATGEEISRVRLDGAVVGDPIGEPTIAPDGTLYGLGLLPFGEFRFFAAATQSRPGPMLWPNSGYNWARTNSRLPD